MRNLNTYAVVKQNSTNINSSVIKYNWTKKICSGEGLLQLELKSSHSISIGDVITITENGTKKGTYTVETVSEDKKLGSLLVDARDGFKLLKDYFIDDLLEVYTSQSSRTWIETILNRAGVTYSFTTVSYGVALSDTISLGMQTAVEAVTPLLQMNGWYMYFNADNTCIIGSLSESPDSYTDVFAEDENLLSISVDTNDASLRNRCVVWGGNVTGADDRAFADVSKPTAWDIDASDIRTVAIGNSSIRSYYIANVIAQKVLAEFANLNSVKTLTAEGATTETLGSFVFVKSKAYDGLGRITTLGSTVSSKGFITNVILDERCPRIFYYWGNPAEYVYIGTAADGVYRKTLEEDVYTDFSTGLPAGSYVTDLKVSNGLFACVTNAGGGYTRTLAQSSWNVVASGDLIDSSSDTVFSPATTLCKACDINQDTGDMYFVYATASGYTPRSWIVTTDAYQRSVSNYQVVVSGLEDEYNQFIVDIDHDGNNLIGTSYTQTEFIPAYLTYYFTLGAGNPTTYGYTFSTDWHKTVSNSIIAGGKVYYIAQDDTDPTKFMVNMIDFRILPETQSTLYVGTMSASNIAGSLFYNSVDGLLYFSIHDPSTLENIWYKCPISGVGTVEYMHTTSAASFNPIRSSCYGQYYAYLDYEETADPLFPDSSSEVKIKVHRWNFEDGTKVDDDVALETLTSDSSQGTYIIPLGHQVDSDSSVNFDGNLYGVVFYLDCEEYTWIPHSPLDSGKKPYNQYLKGLRVKYNILKGTHSTVTGYTSPEWNYKSETESQTDFYMYYQESVSTASRLFSDGDGAFYATLQTTIKYGASTTFAVFCNASSYYLVSAMSSVLLGTNDKGVESNIAHLGINSFYINDYDSLTAILRTGIRERFRNFDPNPYNPNTYFEFYKEVINNKIWFNSVDYTTGARTIHDNLATSTATVTAAPGVAGENAAEVNYRFNVANLERKQYYLYGTWDGIYYPPIAAYLTLNIKPELSYAIDALNMPVQVEISQSSPAVTFPYSDANGMRVSFYPAKALWFSQDVSGLTGSVIRDVRTFVVPADGGLVVASGEYSSPTGYGQQILAITNAELASTPVSEDGTSEWTTIETISAGTGECVEASNMALDPYLFYSVDDSGTPRFFERLPEDIGFTEYSSNLPSSKITVIRLDDRI